MGILQSVRLVKENSTAEADDQIKVIAASRKVTLERESYYNSLKKMTTVQKTAEGSNATTLSIGVLVGGILTRSTKFVLEVTTGASVFGGSPAVTLTIGGSKIRNALQTLTLMSGVRQIGKEAAIAS